MPHTPKSLERTDKIIQAAGKLFARQGYNGTSTREIAQLADVSENTLFRHFDHKEDIFWAAIRWQLTGLKPARDLLSGIERGDSPEVVLPKIIEILEDTVVYRSELLRLIAIAIIELPEKSDGLLSQYFTPVFSTIRKYLEMNIKNRTIRDLDSTMLTSAMIMTALTHPGIYNLIGGKNLLSSNSQEQHRKYVRFWLELIVPRMPAYPSPMARIPEEHPG
jgi:AcrR family transcriptional regulator